MVIDSLYWHYVICPKIICPANHMSNTSYVLQGGESFIFPTQHLSYRERETSFVLHFISPTLHLSYTLLVLQRERNIICPKLQLHTTLLTSPPWLLYDDDADTQRNAPVDLLHQHEALQHSHEVPSNIHH